MTTGQVSWQSLLEFSNKINRPEAELMQMRASGLAQTQPFLDESNGVYHAYCDCKAISISKQ